MDLATDDSRTFTLRDMKHLQLSLDDLPVNVLAVDDEMENFYLNKQALHFLSDGDTERIEKVVGESFNINPMFQILINNVKESASLPEQDISITKFDGSIIDVEISLYYLCEKKITLAFFRSVTSRDYLKSLSVLHVIKNDLLKLTPYLNNFGKEMLDDIWGKIYLEDSNEKGSIKNDNLLKIIQTKYPRLTNSELMICSMFAVGVPISEMASALQKTDNNIRVAAHRISKKLGVRNTKEMIRTLVYLVNQT